MRRLGVFGRSVLVVLLALLIVATGVFAWRALTGTIDVNVVEPLSQVGSWAVDLGDMYPTMSVQTTLTVANAAPNSIETDVSYVITPDPGGKGFSVSLPKKVTVPGSGQVAFTATVTATKSAQPGPYHIEFYLDR